MLNFFRGDHTDHWYAIITQYLELGLSKANKNKLIAISRIARKLQVILAIDA
jgi:hypothetical protein